MITINPSETPREWTDKAIADALKARSRAGHVSLAMAAGVGMRIREDYEASLKAKDARIAQLERQLNAQRGATLFDRLRASIRVG